jgi:hypothetical protein
MFRSEKVSKKYVETGMNNGKEKLEVSNFLIAIYYY